MDLEKLIDAFNECFPDAEHSYAHIVLGDYNTTPENISFCLNTSGRDDWYEQYIRDGHNKVETELLRGVIDAFLHVILVYEVLNG